MPRAASRAGQGRAGREAKHLLLFLTDCETKSLVATEFAAKKCQLMSSLLENITAPRSVPRYTADRELGTYLTTQVYTTPRHTEYHLQGQMMNAILKHKLVRGEVKLGFL